MPDPDVDVETPLEDAAEQEAPAAPVPGPVSSDTSGETPIEANEADVAEQSVIVEDEDDYR